MTVWQGYGDLLSAGQALPSLDARWIDEEDKIFPVLSIRPVSRYMDGLRLSLLHPYDTLIKPPDHHTGADAELEGFAPGGTIKDRPVIEGAGVVDLDHIPVLHTRRCVGASGAGHKEHHGQQQKD